MMNTPQGWSYFAWTVATSKYLHENEKTWDQVASRVATNVFGAIKKLGIDTYELEKLATKYIAERKFLPGGRYLASAGRNLHQIGNCLLLHANDSREGWADLGHQHFMGLMTGAGLGTVYSDVREEGASIKKTGGTATGPVSLANIMNEIGRRVMQGGSRRSALWGGLHWWHPDSMKWIRAKNWPKEIRDLKVKDYNFPASLDMTNISVCLDDDFFAAYSNDSHPKHSLAAATYKTTVHQMLKKAEPGFAINTGINSKECNRNACCEITSEDDSDICNLGSINLARIGSKEEFVEVMKVAVAFLLAGTVYGDVPYPKVAFVREKNRRLGLGLMGVHEWLLKRKKKYGPDEELKGWLEEYAKSTNIAAKWACAWSLSNPIKTRAIAPTGCQRQDTLIVTEEGVLTLGELGRIDGDKWQPLNIKVAQENETQKIATRFFVNGKAKTKKIILGSGIELECTPNHKYRTLKLGAYSWTEAESLQPGDLVVVSLGGYQKETDIDLVPVRKHYRTENVPKFPSKLRPDLAHFLGLFFADGSIYTKGIRIACNIHEDDWKDIAKLGEALFNIKPTIEKDPDRGGVSVCFNSSALLRWLYTNNLDKPECLEVMVPSAVRCSSRKSLISFVEGYWRGDGSSSGDNKYIYTANRALAQQMIVIARAIGQDARIYSHVSGMGSQIYRVNFIRTRRRCHTVEIDNQLKKNGLLNVTVDDVVSIQDSECLTCDIEVPETTTYLANGVVSHNTIGIVGETTTGIEPIFCVAYKRRYLKGNVVHYQYVIDPTAKRLIEEGGLKPEDVEDAYVLAGDVERRVAFQAWVQGYVDHAISSTINLPPWGSEFNNEDKEAAFAAMLIKYLPKLRGITCYPDGARDGQPLTPVRYSTAIRHFGKEFVEGEAVVEQADVCDITKGGTCGE